MGGCIPKFHVSPSNHLILPSLLLFLLLALTNTEMVTSQSGDYHSSVEAFKNVSHSKITFRYILFIRALSEYFYSHKRETKTPEEFHEEVVKSLKETKDCLRTKKSARACAFSLQIGNWTKFVS